MYPRAFFDTYWRGSLRNEVFVAMSFAKEFEPIWKNAIEPAIGDIGMKANRVNATVLSGDVITKILDGIAHAALVFVDVTKMTRGGWRGQRNGNVMYELGIAHTVRPDTDVIVVRSDKGRLPFDFAGIQVHSYSNADARAARKQFRRILDAARQERAKVMSLVIERVRQRLDRSCLRVMFHRGQPQHFQPFTLEEIPEPERNAIPRLLDLEIIRCEIPQHGEFHYAWTDFGIATYWNANLV